MEMGVLFADVILPLAVHNFFTYSVPAHLQKDILPGQRVVVQFGKNKLYTALVHSVHSNKPEAYKTKDIESILDKDPIVNELQFKLWKWMADYYMCTPGEVMNAALPSGLKLSSETKLLLKKRDGTQDEGEINEADLTDDELLVFKALKKKNVITLQDAEKIVQYGSPHAVIKSMLEKGVVLVFEDLKEKFKPKVEEFVCLGKAAQGEENLKAIFDELEKRAFKQLELLMELVHRSSTQKEIKKSDLLKSQNFSPAVFDALVKKNIIEVYDIETGRFGHEKASELSKKLSAEQQSALDNIKTSWKEKDVVLFHGVTSSGKTEIYVRLIEETLQQGKQVLYLLPEIALTTQVVARIKKYFGDKLGVYHSRFNENERVEIWKNILMENGGWKMEDGNSQEEFLKLKGTAETTKDTKKINSPQRAQRNSRVAQASPLRGDRGGAQVILGARSSLFLPYSNLGLIIVDEEHDASYKQFDPAPRYNARDAAIMLAGIHRNSSQHPLGRGGTKVLLGSATPSIESYFNAKEKKFGLVELNTRYGGVQMPEILLADVKDATKRKKMKSHFSPLLMENIEAALKNKEQVILFQNRRGFAPHLQCKTCGWVPQCRNCDVSLVYHKTGNQLRCHYCGYMNQVPPSCSACGSPEMQMKNFGTEKIEEELELFFPDARIARMDYDSTRSKFAYEKLLHDFQDGTIDILVGTQMVTKGLDFENVSTVGILSADQLLHFPDFRAHERSFQMLAQVSGRAGRKSKRGKVILQTWSPEQGTIQQVIANDYLKMYLEELAHRKEFQYPPFHRIIELTVQDKSPDKVNAFSDELGELLRKDLGKRVLGPEFPLVPRVKNLYLKKIVIKIAREESANTTRNLIRKHIDDLHRHEAYKYVRVQADVDPV